MPKAKRSTFPLAELGYLSESQTAKLVGVGVPTLRNWRASGKGPPFTSVSGKLVAYPRDAVARWLESRTVVPGSPAAPTMIDGRKGRRPAQPTV